MQQKIKIVGITGGSGSGKTTAARILKSALEKHCPEGAICDILFQDSYYYDQSLNYKGDGSVNYDHPSAIDFDLLSHHLSMLIKGESIQIPVYDFCTHSRKSQTTLMHPRKFIIVDGTLILTQNHVRHFLMSSLFLDVPEELRFQRRLQRDVKERGRTPDGVEIQFFSCVKPMHDAFVEPSKIHATNIAKSELPLDDAVTQFARQILNL